MDYVLLTYLVHDDDDPHYVYSEVDKDRMETRRVEFFDNGMCFAYGGDRGHEEVLNPEPFPTDLRPWNKPGEVEAVTIPRQLFIEVWGQAQETPDGFMGMFY